MSTEWIVLLSVGIPVVWAFGVGATLGLAQRGRELLDDGEVLAVLLLWPAILLVVAGMAATGRREEPQAAPDRVSIVSDDDAGA